MIYNLISIEVTIEFIGQAIHEQTQIEFQLADSCK